MQAQEEFHFLAPIAVYMDLLQICISNCHMTSKWLNNEVYVIALDSGDLTAIVEFSAKHQHSITLLQRSGTTQQVKRIPNMADFQEKMQRLPSSVYSLYGDPAYPILPYLLAPFGGASITSAEAQFNKSITAVQVTVEWTFGHTI